MWHSEEMVQHMRRAGLPEELHIVQSGHKSRAVIKFISVCRIRHPQVMAALQDHDGGAA